VESLSRVLFSLYRGTPRHGEWVVACLDGAWSGLLGARLAAACRPVRFVGSELTIEAADIHWAEAVKSVKPELIEKLRTATADVVKAVVVVSR
jgi:hypothetical protein